MGTGIVLLFWAVAGTVAAGLGSAVLGIATSILARGRTRLILLASLLPFASLFWAGAVFVFQACVNAAFLSRDCGIGETFSCPLPNGYQLHMIDVPDWAGIYPPTPSGHNSLLASGTPVVSNVRTMGIVGRHFFGGCSSRKHGSTSEVEPDSFFILDSMTGHCDIFSDFRHFDSQATKMGLLTRMEPVATVYAKYRPSWFDLFALLLLVALPVSGFIMLARAILRARRLPQPQS